jgi:hypothetical protein
MESLTGVLSQEPLQKPCYEAVMGEREDGEPFCAHGCSVMHLARAHRPVSSFEMRIKTRSGQKRWVNVSNLIVVTEEGPYLVHLIRDSQGTHDTMEMARGLISFLPRRRPPSQEGGTFQPSPRASLRSLHYWPRGSRSKKSARSSTSLRPRSETTSAHSCRPWGRIPNSRFWPRLGRWASSPARALPHSASLDISSSQSLPKEWPTLIMPHPLSHRYIPKRSFGERSPSVGGGLPHRGLRAGLAKRSRLTDGRNGEQLDRSMEGCARQAPRGGRVRTR